MEITPIAAQEAACLVPLLQDLHALHVDHLPARYLADPAAEALTDWLREWLASDRTEALVARSPKGVVMGYLIWEIEERAALPVRAAERRAMVHHIAVDAPFRRIGVGKALMSAMKARACAQGVDVIATTYATFNAASAALMQGMGLSPTLVYAEWRPPSQAAQTIPAAAEEQPQA